MNDCIIRPAEHADAEAIARLVTQLGYPITASEMVGRLKNLLGRPDYQTFVAEDSGLVVGMVGAYLGLAFEFDGIYGRLTGLAVDEGFRGRGIGRRLMEHIEGWLKTQGAVLVLLTSGSHRAEAHEFYRTMGFEQTGVRFAKRLQP
jgi:ribosomal protein S18 acetylase RimI-like enzyme